MGSVRFAIPLVFSLLFSINDVSYGQRMDSSRNDRGLASSALGFASAVGGGTARYGTLTPEQISDMDIKLDMQKLMEIMARSCTSSMSMMDMVYSFAGAIASGTARYGTLTPEQISDMDIMLDIMRKLMEIMVRSCTSSKSMMLQDLNMKFAALLSQEEPVQTKRETQ